METDKDNDFTFCQVGTPDKNGFVDQNVIPGIRNICIQDESSSNSRDVTNFRNNGLPSNTTTVKENKVGSFSFDVISTSQTQPSQSTGQTSPDDAGSSRKNQAVQKLAAKKPAARAKVPFEKGYSQMDWIKLTRTHPDLAGLNGRSNRRLIPMSEVKQNQTEGSMWTVLKGRVYNIYPYMKFHPGGVDMLTKAVGKDCTSLFNKYHAWVNAEFMLEKCLVGILDNNATDRGK